MSKCLVCDWEIKDTEVKVIVDGKSVGVCCEECAAKITSLPPTSAT